jgi:hypothetical protein
MNATVNLSDVHITSLEHAQSLAEYLRTQDVKRFNANDYAEKCGHKNEYVFAWLTSLANAVNPRLRTLQVANCFDVSNLPLVDVAFLGKKFYKIVADIICMHAKSIRVLNITRPITVCEETLARFAYAVVNSGLRKLKFSHNFVGFDYRISYDGNTRGYIRETMCKIIRESKRLEVFDLCDAEFSTHDYILLTHELVDSGLKQFIIRYLNLVTYRDIENYKAIKCMLRRIANHNYRLQKFSIKPRYWKQDRVNFISNCSFNYSCFHSRRPEIGLKIII